MGCFCNNPSNNKGKPKNLWNKLTTDFTDHASVKIIKKILNNKHLKKTLPPECISNIKKEQTLSVFRSNGH